MNLNEAISRLQSKLQQLSSNPSPENIGAVESAASMVVALASASALQPGTAQRQQPLPKIVDTSVAIAVGLQVSKVTQSSATTIGGGGLSAQIATEIDRILKPNTTKVESGFSVKDGKYLKVGETILPQPVVPVVSRKGNFGR